MIFKKDKEIIEDKIRDKKLISLANIRGEPVAVAESDWIKNEFVYKHGLGCLPYYLILYKDKESDIFCSERNKATITFKCTNPCSCALYLIK